jgi:hypothetical protein
MTKMRRWVVVVVLLLVAGVPFSLWLYRQIEIDKCLDAGGAWNYEQRHCLFEAPKQ